MKLGIKPIRSLVNVGGGVYNLVSMPLTQYRKDGRILKGFLKRYCLVLKNLGFQLGATAFAKVN